MDPSVFQQPTPEAQARATDLVTALLSGATPEILAETAAHAIAEASDLRRHNQQLQTFLAVVLVETTEALEDGRIVSFEVSDKTLEAFPGVTLEMARHLEQDTSRVRVILDEPYKVAAS